MIEDITFRIYCQICGQEMVGGAIFNNDPKFGISQSCRIVENFEIHTRKPGHKTASADVFDYRTKKHIGLLTRKPLGILYQRD